MRWENYLINSRLTLTVAIAAGLAGGLLSRFVVPTSAQAQTQTQAQPSAPKEIRAQSFVLVDQKGTAYGLLGFSPQGRPIIKLLDAKGQTLWSTEPGLRLPSE
jgi:hypothetical protein